METLTIEEIARFFSEKKEIETSNFINKNANKLYCASHRKGTYGKIFLNFIKSTYLTPLNFNGMLTALALEITNQLENKGYNFKVIEGKVFFNNTPKQKPNSNNMKNTLKLFVLIAFATLLTSCGSRGWSCQKRYVYIDINKDYIKKHQAGADSFDKMMLKKASKSNVNGKLN